MNQAIAIATQSTTDSFDASTVYVARRDDLPSGLPSAVTKMIELFDGSRNVEQVASETRISMAKVSAVVRKLTDLGILSMPTLRLGTLTNMSETRLAHSFNEQEEAFFATEVEPIDMCNEPFATSLGERASLFVSELIIRLKGSPAF